jgi:hypothetical protein
MAEKLQIIGMYQFKQKRYVYIGFDGKWLNSYGNATEGFVAIFWGDSGSGKTEAAVQLAKYLSGKGNVLYLSWEQKDRSTIWTAFERNGLLDMNKKVFLSPGGTIESVIDYLKKKKSPKYVFMDSIDFSKWSIEDFERLRTMFPKKNLIIVAHGKGALPKRALAAEIMFDADMKCHVKKGVVFLETRFKQGGEPFIVHQEKAKLWHPYLFIEAEAAPKRVKKMKVLPPKNIEVAVEVEEVIDEQLN